jgi:carbonic anhydrase
MHTFTVSIALTLMFGCSPSQTTRPVAEPVAGIAPHAWGYIGAGAPENWSSISREYATCASGRFQSPIDLAPIAAADVDSLEVSYRPDILRIVNNGHTIQVNHRADSTLRVGGHPFRLLQFHFHSPSEHTESGRRHDLELHLVHKDELGNYAVLAVFIDEGAERRDVSDLWRYLPEMPDEMDHVYEGELTDPTDFLPTSLRHYQYHGSLTTPPCTETVIWNVLATPLKISSEHIEQFRERYAANARPVQPRAGWCLAPHVIGSVEMPVSSPHPTPF